MSLTQGNGPQHGGTCPLCGEEYDTAFPVHLRIECDDDVVGEAPDPT